MKPKTITIGIPAYNEEKTIGKVLRDVYAQKFDDVTLKEVLVFNDGSEDDTVKIVKTFKNENLKLIDGKIRKGMVAGLNALCETATGDCLIILNSDIRIKDVNFAQKLSEPIFAGRADLTSCDQLGLEPRTVVESALVTSMEIKSAVFNKFNNGNNVYTSHGSSRGFSRKLYNKIHFTHSVGEDAYAYLFAIFNNMSYEYVSDTGTYVRAPAHMEDHYKQASRFEQSKSQFNHEFGEEFVNKMYYLPSSLIIKETLKKAVVSPFSTALYIFIFALMKVRKPKTQSISNTWEVVHSSKET